MCCKCCKNHNTVHCIMCSIICSFPLHYSRSDYTTHWKSEKSMSCYQQGQEIVSLPWHVRTSSGPTQCAIQWVPVNFSSPVKWVRCDPDNLFPSNAINGDKYSYTSTLQVCMLCIQTTLLYSRLCSMYIPFKFDLPQNPLLRECKEKI